MIGTKAGFSSLLAGDADWRRIYSVLGNGVCLPEIRHVWVEMLESMLESVFERERYILMSMSVDGLM